MTRTSLRLLLASLGAVLALSLAACGGDDNKKQTGASGGSKPDISPGKVLSDAKRGGKLMQLGGSDVDYLDPGHTYFQGGYQVVYAMGRPLYGFKAGAPDQVPDLAESDPEVSEDAKMITVKIRKGVKFGPPVNREVTSKDVKYAFERFFSENVGGQYGTYFEAIEGVPEKPTKGPKPISGITTPDDQTIVFKLTKAAGVSVAAALVMPISMPVPKEYASKFDAKNPSTYNTHVVATGPYMIPNDAEGKLTGYKAGKSIKLVRNPSWDAKTDFKPAYLDEIDMSTNESNASVAAQRVLKGTSMVLDTNPPAAELKLAFQKYKDQLVQVPSGGWRWFPLNTKLKPLDNINVRKAIIAGFDREAARKARGGKLVGDIPTHFLPPEFPGFDEAGGPQGPGLDFMSKPRGDMALAASYMKKAGFPSGKYTGKDELLLVTANVDPGKAQAEVAKAQLEKLGFKVKFRAVPQDATYTEFCQVPAKEVAVCGAAGWFQDFRDPQSMLDPTFKGANITKMGNNNLGQLDVPEIDAAMDKAAVMQGAERLKAWGEIDKQITAQAPAIPFLWDKQSNIGSKNVNLVPGTYNVLTDFTYTSLK
jgi:peptide/nickel transport system substrate-binding protein